MAAPTSTEDDGVNSVLGKVRAIIETLAAERHPIGISSLARKSGVPKASAHRLCRALAAWGVVEQVDAGLQLGARLFELGQRVPGRRHLRDAALPFMEDLFVATSQTVHLAVLDAGEVLYVERIIGRRSDKTPSSVAARMPSYCTATGKCLLAYSDRDVAIDICTRGLIPRTPYTITSPRLLLSQLSSVRRKGFAIEQEEMVTGFASIAAPVFQLGNSVLAAISITSATRNFDVERLLPPLRTATRALSRQLGGRPEI